MKLVEDGLCSKLSFTSYTEAIAFAETHSSKCEDATEADDGSKGAHTYADAHKLATCGWADGRKRVQRLQSAISVTARVFKPEVVYDVVGNGGVDVGLALAGVPECFMDWQDSETSQACANGPIVHIVFNGSVSASMDAAVIENRGAAVLAVIDALEAAGKRVELTYIKANSATGGADWFLIEIPLKSASASVQPDQMTFALVHPSMNRRIGFSLTKQCGRNGRAAAIKMFGSALPTTWRHESADIFIPRLDRANGAAFRTPVAAQAWVLSTLRAQGVEITEGASHA